MPLSQLSRLFVVVALSWGSLPAQSLDDGIMMPKRNLFTGFVYSRDSWDQYWEGRLQRKNGNLGTVTTETDTWYADYGLTDRVNLLVSIPYVRTDASQGVLHSMQGFQDITFAGKYRFFERQFRRLGSLRLIAVGSGAIPLTNYTPDFLPLSIGSASKRVSGRLTVNFQSRPGWFVNGSSAYTWRGDVTLDRPYYYTEGHLFLTNVVNMPGVFDYVASAGYNKHGWMAEFLFAQQRTQGGGDIRRQDAPFVSNRMNASRVGGNVMFPIPKLRELALHLTYAYTVDGRNVGQATTFSTALFYRINIHKGGIR